MKTKVTIKELSESLKQPVPYVTAFINIAKQLGLVSEAGKSKVKGKGKSATLYEVPATWINGEAKPSLKNPEPEEEDEIIEDVVYNASMDDDPFGDGYQDYIEENALPCDADLLKHYTGEEDNWGQKAFERGHL